MRSRDCEGRSGMAHDAAPSRREERGRAASGDGANGEAGMNASAKGVLDQGFRVGGELRGL